MMSKNSYAQIALICTFTFSGITVFSQRNYVRMDQIEGVPMTITYNLDPEEKDIDGSPYLYDDWKEIKIERVDGMNLLAPEGKYHLELEELITNIDGTLFKVDNKNQIKNFFIDERKFIGSSYGQGYFGFFEVLVDTDRVILLKKHICRIKRGRPSNGIVDATKDEYIRDDEYYIKKVEENSKPLNLKITKKNILIKSNQYPELSNYLSKVKGDFKQEEELIKVFEAFQ